MEASVSTPRRRFGRTFIVSVTVLGLIALIQFGAIIWLVTRPKKEKAPQEESGAKLAVTDPFAVDQTTKAPVLPAPTPVPAVGTATSSNDSGPPAPASQQAAAATPAGAPLQLARPTPVPAEEREVGVQAMLSELLDQARALRSRGDTINAITRLREADTMNPGNPETISELAYTYEKMGLGDKALQEWRRILDLGEDAGPLYSAAQAKLNQGNAAPAAAGSPSESASPGTGEGLPGIEAGKSFGILDVTAADQTDGDSEKKMVLKIPIKKRPGLQVDVRDVAVQVLFYDMLEDATVVQTNAQKNWRWTTIPADWSDDDIEILEVEYNQPRRSGEKRTYFGYIVRVYFKKELQAWRAEPAKLRVQYPAPPTLQSEDLKPK